MKETPTADGFRAVLYGSLAKTGEGHGTEKIIEGVLGKVSIEKDENTGNLPHPNTMDLFAYEKGVQTAFLRVYSIGGGAIRVEGRGDIAPYDVYDMASFSQIKEYLMKKNMRLPDYAFEREGAELEEYLAEVWAAMKNAVCLGVKTSGILPGGLGVERRAPVLFRGENEGEEVETREHRLVCAYAFAVSEENASGGTIVTAPTCGACGVLPAVLYYLQEKKKYSDKEIVRALAAAGIIGNLIKTNASISGAECGCQAEIGSACSMAAAAVAELYGMSLE